MRMQALAVDYDGTIAHHGAVSKETLDALSTLRRSGRRLVLVTGRILDDLAQVGPDLGTFDFIVAENGAVLFDPRRQETTALADPPPEALLQELARRNVPYGRGRVIVATSVPHDAAVLEAIRVLGIEWQISYNKGSVMALPSGITKAVGLSAALARMGVSPHNVVGVGDAENDHNFLRICEVAAAPGNALPAIKERADVVLRRRNGRGVAELIERYVLNDFAGVPAAFARYRIALGSSAGGTVVELPVYGSNVLVVGPSGAGKTTLVGLLVERLVEQGYQLCVLDPEGDYSTLDPLIVVGTAATRPTADEIALALERVDAGVVVNLVALSPAERVDVSAELLGNVLATRAARGRPHWIVLDEAHHLLPAQGSPATALLPPGSDGLCLVTTHARMLPAAALAPVNRLLVVGDDAGQQISEFAAARGLQPPSLTNDVQLLEGEALLLSVGERGLGRPLRFRVASRRTEHHRHVRKYSAGDLGSSSFYFRGPHERLNLRAYNVTAFVEMARGVDEATWMHHLCRGDYTRWFAEQVKDPEAADAIAAVERRARELGADESRRRVLDYLQARYTAAG